MFSVGGEFRRTLEMYGESVAADARVERLIVKIEGEAELVTVVRNCPVKIIDQKLRAYPSKVRSVGILVTLLPALSVMSFVVIPREERYLEAHFGDEYARYKASVPRWW